VGRQQQSEMSVPTFCKNLATRYPLAATLNTLAEVQTCFLLRSRDLIGHVWRLGTAFMVALKADSSRQRAHVGRKLTLHPAVTLSLHSKALSSLCTSAPAFNAVLVLTLFIFKAPNYVLARTLTERVVSELCGYLTLPRYHTERYLKV